MSVHIMDKILVILTNLFKENKMLKTTNVEGTFVHLKERPSEETSGSHLAYHGLRNRKEAQMHHDLTCIPRSRKSFLVALNLATQWDFTCNKKLLMWSAALFQTLRLSDLELVSPGCCTYVYVAHMNFFPFKNTPYLAKGINPIYQLIIE